MYLFIIEPCEVNNINQANTPTKLGDSDVMSVLGNIQFLYDLFIFIQKILTTYVI